MQKMKTWNPLRTVLKQLFSYLIFGFFRPLTFVLNKMLFVSFRTFLLIILYKTAIQTADRSTECTSVRWRLACQAGGMMRHRQQQKLKHALQLAP